MLDALPEIEITEAPKLTSDEAAILDQHSFVNILNILTGELEVLGLKLADKANALEKSLQVCRHYTRELHDPEAVLNNASCASTYATIIDREIAALVNRFPDTASRPDVQQGCESISAILDVLMVRSREILDRADTSNWRTFKPQELQENFLQVFSAIQIHSRGRFGFAFPPQEPGPIDYLVRLQFDSGGAKFICMPPVLVDVMRDLIANARKYTEPGGTIDAALVQSAAEISFSITDTGCGIPERELPKVVQFGYRAENVITRSTRGGGFGLTKAVHTIKRLGGRLWIASQIGKGTRVRFTIPK